MCWVAMLSRGSAQTQFTLSFGKLDQFFFDPTLWWWPKVTPFMVYSEWGDLKRFLKHGLLLKRFLNLFRVEATDHLREFAPNLEKYKTVQIFFI